MTFKLYELCKFRVLIQPNDVNVCYHVSVFFIVTLMK